MSTKGQNIINTPSGGGAVSGLGEKFSPDLFTGTGNFSVPIDVPEGLNGFQPELTLGYSTGSGSGPYGLGWNIGIPGVTRKTAKGVPLYDDTDTFILSGAEDLIDTGAFTFDMDGQTFNGRRYRPRTEGLYAQIVHVNENGHNFWRVTSKDGLTSYYGLNQAVTADPRNTRKIFAWHLARTQDTFGNRINYHYSHDTQTDPERPFTQVYLNKISYLHYGQNQTPLIEIHLDHEDRPDPFSTYNQGFEVRTRKRCTAIRTVTHPQGEPARTVKQYTLRYADEGQNPETPINGASVLTEIQVHGIKHRAGQPDETEEMPPINFTYTDYRPADKKFTRVEGNSLPMQGLSSGQLTNISMFGNGLPDIVEAKHGVPRYWRNLGNGTFDAPRTMKEAPAGLSLQDPDVQLVDADGDGRIDMLVNKQGQAGYYSSQYPDETGVERDLWDAQSFRPYKQAPSVSLADPNLKMLDLTGNGVTDALYVRGKLTAYFSDPIEGWSGARPAQVSGRQGLINIDFSDPRMHTADMSGDGLQDIVFIDNGTVRYWPSLGYGNFGGPVTMGKAPRYPRDFDPARVTLGDVDGSGTTDIIYAAYDRIYIWINKNGNAWSEPIEISGTPPVHDPQNISVIDLYGNGTSGILYSGDALRQNRPQWYFLDLTGGIKPYLLCQMNNNMGSVTRVQYKPSTTYYLADQKNKSTRWKTPLPFPVQVVAKTEVVDQISKGKLSTVYEYHHGYWDGGEREFRGFGRVDTYDTEFFDEYNQKQEFYTGAFKPKGGLHVHNELEFNPVTQPRYSTPTLTKNWFHLGPVGGEFGDWRELTFQDEYWQEDPSVLKRPAATEQMLSALPRRIKRDAIRTLKGNMLRSETYAFQKLQGKAARPFSVSENQFGIRNDFETPDAGQAVIGRFGIVFRPPGTVFFPHQVASRSSRWEEGYEPLTTFEFTGRYDDYGNPRRSTSLALPRGIMPPYDAPRGSDPGEPVLGTLSEAEYAYKDTADVYLCDRVTRSASYEVVQSSSENVFDLGDSLMADPVPLQGNGILNALGCSLNYYDGPAFTGLPYGDLGDHGAVTKTETLIITDDLIGNAYGLNRPECFKQNPDYSGYPQDFQNSLQNNDPHLGYVEHDEAPYIEGWYRTDVQNRYDFQTPGTEVRGHVLQSKDGFDNLSEILYDGYNFLPVEARQYYTAQDYLATQALYNYRLLKPLQITDENQNRTRFNYSPLGLLRGIALIGQYGKNEGDIVSENPLEYVPSTTFDYNLNAFSQNQQPVWAETIQREKHWQQDPTHDSPTIKKVEYSDGFGRIIQTRAQAEDIIFGSTAQKRKIGDSGLPADQNAPNQPAVAIQKGASEGANVVVSGWKVYNNKGKVVEEYEPFYDKKFDFKSAESFTSGLVKMSIRYDAGDRPTETLHPDGSISLVVYGTPDQMSNPPLVVTNNKNAFTPSPWERFSYDQNDLGSITNVGPYTGAYTPKSETVDALGRTVKTTQHNSQPTSNPSVFEDVVMKYEYDVRGNLIKVTDPFNRTAFTYHYDLRPPEENEEGEKEPLPPLWTNHIDSGTSTIVYDAAGKPIQSKDAKDAESLSSYDRLQRPLYGWTKNNSNDSLRMTLYTIYGEQASNPVDLNLLGKPWQQYDESGQVTFGGYDFKGNVLTKAKRTIRDDELKTALTNYQSYLVDWTNLPNILSSDTFITTNHYDALDRITQIRLPENVNSEVKLIIPSYNRAGSLDKVSYDGETYVEHIAYNAKGQRLLIAFGNGIMTRYTYDNQTFRLSRQRSEKYTYSKQGSTVTYNYQTGTVREDNALAYDLVGNIVQINDRTPECGIGGTDSLDKHFTYDPLYRLTSATGRENIQGSSYPFPGWNDKTRSTDPNTTQAYTRNYTYDKLGNIERLRQIGNTPFTREYIYPETSGVKDNNQLESISIGSDQYQYAYDAAGNQLMENTNRKFEWDAGNRLLLFKNQAGTGEPSIMAQYLYDNEGNRVKKIVRKQGGDYEIRTYIDGVFEYFTDEDKEQNTIHIMDDESRIATVRVGDAMGDSTLAIKYILENNIGSSTALLDDNGDLVNRQEYYPFGETSFGSFAKKRYQYTGKERDGESGLYYYGARYYSAWTCRFISVDPKSAEQPNFTPYSYANNNPIRMNDPSGMQADDAGGGGGGESATTDNTQVHTVVADDTLYQLAEQYGTTVEALREANNLDPADDGNLQIGTELRIPAAEGAMAEGSTPSYDWGSDESSTAASISNDYSYFHSLSSFYSTEVAEQSNGDLINSHPTDFSQATTGFGGTTGLVGETARSVEKGYSINPFRNKAPHNVVSKWAGRSGGVLAVVSLGGSFYDAYDSGFSNRANSRLAVQTAITAIAVFGGPVGIALSIGLSIADSYGAFDNFYNSFDGTRRIP